MEETTHILGTGSKYILPAGEACLSPPNYCHLMVPSLSSIGHSIALSGLLLQDGGEHGKTNGFHDCGPAVTHSEKK